KHFWPTGTAVGKRLKLGGLDSRNPWLDVVGVVGDVKHWSLADVPSPQIYQPLAQWPQRSATLVLRTAVDRPASVAQAVRQVVLGQGMRWVGAGLLLGAGLAFGSAKAMSGLLYGVAAGDPLTYGGAALLLGAIATLAIYLPARQVSRVTPNPSTQYE